MLTQPSPGDRRDPRRQVADASGAAPAGGHSDEVRALAAMAWAEARGEPRKGQLAVADAIVNRTLAEGFPDDIVSVIEARVPGSRRREFDPMRGKASWRDLPTPPASFVDQIATHYRERLAGTAPDHSNGAVFFSVDGTNLSHDAITAEIGNHVFGSQGNWSGAKPVTVPSLASIQPPRPKPGTETAIASADTLTEADRAIPRDLPGGYYVPTPDSARRILRGQQRWPGETPEIRAAINRSVDEWYETGPGAGSPEGRARQARLLDLDHRRVEAEELGRRRREQDGPTVGPGEARDAIVSAEPEERFTHVVDIGPRDSIEIDLDATRAAVGHERASGLTDDTTAAFARLRSRYGGPMDVISTTRTTAEQAALYRRGGAARPGRSEHEHGEAMDVKVPREHLTEFLAAASEAGFPRMGTYSGSIDGPLVSVHLDMKADAGPWSMFDTKNANLPRLPDPQIRSLMEAHHGGGFEGVLEAGFGRRPVPPPRLKPNSEALIAGLPPSGRVVPSLPVPPASGPVDGLTAFAGAAPPPPPAGVPSFVPKPEGLEMPERVDPRLALAATPAMSGPAPDARAGLPFSPRLSGIEGENLETMASGIPGRGLRALRERRGLPPAPPASALTPLTDTTLGRTAEGRQQVLSADGSVSTERSITGPWGPGGTWRNIPSMFGGREVPETEAVEIMRGNNWRDPETGRDWSATYPSVAEAEAAAKARSAGIQQRTVLPLAFASLPGLEQDRPTMPPASRGIPRVPSGSVDAAVAQALALGAPDGAAPIPAAMPVPPPPPPPARSMPGYRTPPESILGMSIPMRTRMGMIPDAPAAPRPDYLPARLPQRPPPPPRPQGPVVITSGGPRFGAAPAPPPPRLPRHDRGGFRPFGGFFSSLFGGGRSAPRPSPTYGGAAYRFGGSAPSRAPAFGGSYGRAPSQTQDRDSIGRYTSRTPARERPERRDRWG